MWNSNITMKRIPPTAHIEGIDLVTEGILTLSAAEKRMKEYLDEYEDNVRKKEILDLDKKDGATKLVRLLVEECTDVVFMMGQANNPAHQNLDAPVSLNIKDENRTEYRHYAGKTGETR